MKSKEEINELKEELEILREELNGLTEEEMEQISGGNNNSSSEPKYDIGFSLFFEDFGWHAVVERWQVKGTWEYRFVHRSSYKGFYHEAILTEAEIDELY